MTRLSPHFTLEELIVTETGLPNTPSAAVRLRLALLAQHALEPIRRILAAPMRITSGYRSDEVNQRVGGVSSSMHRWGEAADFVPVGLPVLTAMILIQQTQLDLDQVILYESRGFIHVGYSTRRPNRREYLTCTGTKRYVSFASSNVIGTTPID